ncbi:MAG: DNA mismatch repair protein MutT [Patescibacteria group bacterium]|nr:MAG: DNA mismatch repair protein MutT [Patescibacteria group bacterium]
MKSDSIISVIRFCPLCGSSKLNKSNNFILSCSDCSFIYYDNPKVTVCSLIFNKDGQLLLTKRAEEPMKGFLDLPGGFVDQNETLEQALIRELSEELQLSVQEEDLIYYSSSVGRYEYSGINYFTVLVCYFCKKIVSGQEIKFDKDEIADIVFVRPEELNIKLLGMEDTKNLMTKFLKNKDYERQNFKN